MLANVAGLPALIGSLSSGKSLYFAYTQAKGGLINGVGQQFIQCPKEKRVIAGGSRRKIRRQQTDNLKMGAGRNASDIRQSKKLSLLYHLSLDELIDFDLDVQEIQEVIDKTSEEVQNKVDWTKAWGKKYPILTTYQKEVDTDFYAVGLTALLDELKKKYGYDRLGRCERGTPSSQRRDPNEFWTNPFLAISLLGKGASVVRMEYANRHSVCRSG